MQDTMRWRKLCEEAATEQDSQRLIELVKEINNLLEEKQFRLNRKNVDGTSPNGNGKLGLTSVPSTPISGER